LLLGALSVAVLGGFVAPEAPALGSPAQSGEGLGALATNSLVPPAADQLLGGEGRRASRAARRANPQEIARRAASRTAFQGLTPGGAADVTDRAFPELEQVSGGIPLLEAGQHVVRYPTDYSAELSLSGRRDLIESFDPIAATTAHGARSPFDLRLTSTGDGRFQPIRSSVGVVASSDLTHGVSLPSLGVSLTPLDQYGMALATSTGRLAGAAVHWSARERDSDAVHDLAMLVKASLNGFDLTSMLLSQRSPKSLYFRVGMPAGASLRHAADGSIRVLDHGATLAVVSPVSAEDAEGASVPVAETLRGHTIELQVDLTGDYLYPIAVDPEVNDGQLATTSAGKRSNWEFHTSNSGRFAGSAVYEGVGQEHLETRGTAEYALSDWAYWGYQTQGVSKIYEIKTETSAHNTGAKIESFLEFEQPGGAQETKKLLSTEVEGDAEYAKKAATLCAANAGHEECLPAAGQAHNAVHFQQSATASPGGNYHFSDTLTQGIVSISEPTGTHSTTSFNTTSPSFEFETESEGKKVKVTRANALYGAGGWLTKSAGALQPVAKDAGIGVAATKLEYEVAPGSWETLAEHSYLEHENACQGVQCYPEHSEDWTLSPKLPDGEDTLRYKAEEAMSGTQSLSTEGLATVKVDAAAPHRLSIAGLPYGNELSERPYKLTVHATDGEGTIAPSSGVKSLALFVSGHEVAEVGKQIGCKVAKGECTATAEWSLNGAELGAGRHAIVIVATDNAGNEARLEETISIRHSTPVALGPGSLDLQSGDFSLGAGDVSLGSGLTLGRNYSSRATEAGEEGPLGPQWSLSMTSTESLTELVDGAMLLTAANGGQTIFASLGSGAFESPIGDSNLKLTLEENKTTKQKLAYYLEDPAAHTKTRFTLPSGGGVAWVPSRTEGAVGTDTMTYGAITEYALPTGSKPYGIALGAEGKLWFTDYGTDKIGKITTGGAITEYALPAGSKPRGLAVGQNGELWVAESGTSRLARVTTSGAVSEYALPSGSEPNGVARGPEGNIWFTESGTSKIGKTNSQSPISSEPGTTINYNVPLSGTGLPRMTGSEVAKWGQSDDPVEATAITAPDEPQSWPATGYKRATLYYLDEQGRQVNVAAPSSSPYGSVATTEYNEFNDPIRTLTADNRQRALEAGATSVEKSKLLDTQNTFDGEGAKEGEVEEPGTRLVESLGPQHKISYIAGHEQKEAFARLHSKFFYDEGAPTGETYDLQTKKTTLAQLSNEEEVEVRTTKTSYAGQSNLGWKLRAPTSVTSFGPEGNPLTKGTTEYDPSTGQVVETRATATENTLSYFKQFGETGVEAGKLKAPWGVAVNAEGRLLVVDSANDRIERFNSEGTFMSTFGAAGSGSGQLKEPRGIALDSAGHIWVADTGNNRIEEFSSAGAFIKIVGSLGSESGKLKSPSALLFDPKGNMWVADTGNNRIEKFNKEGVYSSEFGSAGAEAGKLSEPQGIAMDSGEHIWVADTDNNRIQEFSTTGSPLGHFGAVGAGESQLNTPIDLKIDGQGNIWTVDSKNNRAEAFSPGGAYVTQIGYAGTGAGRLTEPRGLAFDAAGKAWITDSGDNRLEQWVKGPNAHDQKTIYYSAEAETFGPCGSHPEWAGLVCETLPAKQPELMGAPPLMRLPALPVTTYAYNMYDEPETIAEAFTSRVRVRTETYDKAGRRIASETTSTGGQALPKISFSYSSTLGLLEKETSAGEERSLRSEFNNLGQLIKYTDADGNVANYKYSGPENDYLLSQVSDSSAGGASSQSYEYDPTTKLPTKLIDSAAGTFTASYDTEGKFTSMSYPYGMCAAYSYNSIGEATNLEYLKTSNCAASEPGIYYQDSRSSSIRGEALSQSSTLASETYTYDPSGRVTETRETPAGEGCTVRAYTYDEEANRVSSTTRAPGVGGACQAEGGTVVAHNYDEGNRLADNEVSYDSFGNVTKLPAADAEGHELTSTFYVDNAVATQTQNGVTNEYKLDPEGRTRELISGSTKTIDHYDGSGEAVAWSESPGKWVRNIAGIDGTLLATQTNGEAPVLQLRDLQGDVVGTIGDKAGETKLLSSYNSSEFGVPTGGKAPPKFAYLGAFGAESSFSSGVITYGATSYVPQTARALQSEAVRAPGLPGGSGSGAPYTTQEEPWNMQGAGREAAEAPGLEAAREQAALEAAEGAVIDPWVYTTMNRSKAAALAKEYFEAESMAVVLEMNDLPGDFLELAGKEAGEIVAEFDNAYKWMDDAGNKLMKCAANKRKVNGRGVNICWFEYEQIEWEPAIPTPFGPIGLGVTLKFPNFSVEPNVNECIYVQGPSLECVADVHVETEL
jgi:streptogramin lyase